MFKEVSSAIERGRVKRATHMDVQSGGTLVCLCIGDQQTLELVGKCDVLVDALI
jgi:hypothetical protein